MCGVRFVRRWRRRGCRMRIAQGVGVCACVRGRRRTSSLSLGLCFAVWLFEWVCACVPRCWACAHKASACTMHSSDVLSSHIRPARAGLHGRSCPAAYAHERCCRMYRAGCRDRLRHPRRRRHRRRAQDVSAGAGRGVIGWARGARESAGGRRGLGAEAGNVGGARDLPASLTCAGVGGGLRWGAPGAWLLQTCRPRRRNGRPCAGLCIRDTSRR